jgi:pyrroloquinoline quinone biosynthesis protein E
VVNFQQILNAYGSTVLFHWLNQRSQAARVVTIHELDRHQLERPESNKTYNNADAVIVQQGAMKDQLVRLGVDANKIELVLHGTDLPAMDESQPREGVMFYGGHHPLEGKGTHAVFQAMALLKTRLGRTAPKLKVHGYFSAEDLTALKELAAQWGLKNDVTWFNQIPMPEALREYRSSLLCVLPFMGSFAGLAATTAAAVGLPVIATKHAGIPEHIGENGIWIDSDNAEEIVEKTERLLGSEELRRDLSHRLRKRAEWCLSWDAVADQTLAVYERALQRKRAGAACRSRQVVTVARVKALGNFVLSGLCRRESWRRALLRLSVKYVAPERPRRFPRQLQIEATSQCNLRCPTCSHAKEKSSGQHLTEEKFRRILDGLPWSPEKVTLSGIGEPLMNPQFFSLVDILAERKIRCEFFTNGTLLTEARRQAILSRDNIDLVAISCDGSQKETFEKLRLGADFDNWKQSVRAFLLQARQRRGKSLNIAMNMVISKENLRQTADILHLAAELGFGHVFLLDPIPLDEIAAALCPPATEVSAARQELTKVANGLGLKLTCYVRRDRQVVKASPGCLQPWEYVFIRANGDVAPCCALFGSDQGAVMGNVLEQKFEMIWRGERYREFRRTSLAGTNDLCRICPMY